MKASSKMYHLIWESYSDSVKLNSLAYQLHFRGVTPIQILATVNMFCWRHILVHFSSDNCFPILPAENKPNPHSHKPENESLHNCFSFWANKEQLFLILVSSNVFLLLHYFWCLKRLFHCVFMHSKTTTQITSVSSGISQDLIVACLMQEEKKHPLMLNKLSFKWISF